MVIFILWTHVQLISKQLRSTPLTLVEVFKIALQKSQFLLKLWKEKLFIEKKGKLNLINNTDSYLVALISMLIHMALLFVIIL